jgi:hemerythrin
MVLYPWDPALETGNAAIDDQHRRLFALANDLAEAIATCPVTDEGLCEEDEDTLANAIFGLADYCVEHFADEEALMASIGYPQLSTHRSLHEQLSGETLRHAADYFNDEGIVPETLAPLFAEWLTSHILQHDMGFAAYLRERRSTS